MSMASFLADQEPSIGFD